MRAEKRLIWVEGCVKVDQQVVECEPHPHANASKIDGRISSTSILHTERKEKPWRANRRGATRASGFPPISCPLPRLSDRETPLKELLLQG
jgi:hypothetical protein